MAVKPPSLNLALTHALREHPPEPKYSAAIALARRYALAIDANPEKLAEIGPKFQAALTALGLTKAPTTTVQPPKTSPQSDALQRLRQRRASSRVD